MPPDAWHPVMNVAQWTGELWQLFPDLAAWCAVFGLGFCGISSPSALSRTRACSSLWRQRQRRLARRPRGEDRLWGRLPRERSAEGHLPDAGSSSVLSTGPRLSMQPRGCQHLETRWVQSKPWHLHRSPGEGFGLSESSHNMYGGLRETESAEFAFPVRLHFHAYVCGLSYAQWMWMDVYIAMQCS